MAGSSAPDVPKMILALSANLETAAKKNDRLIQRPSIFDDLFVPSTSMNVENYLKMLYAGADCSLSCFMVAYIYIHRFLCKNERIALCSSNLRRFILTSLPVAANYVDRAVGVVPYFARLGGIDLEEMCKLEVQFLGGLGLWCRVSDEEYNEYSCKVWSWWDATHPIIPRWVDHHSHQQEEVAQQLAQVQPLIMNADHGNLGVVRPRRPPCFASLDELLSLYKATNLPLTLCDDLLNAWREESVIWPII